MPSNTDLTFFLKLKQHCKLALVFEEGSQWYYGQSRFILQTKWWVSWSRLVSLL